MVGEYGLDKTLERSIFRLIPDTFKLILINEISKWSTFKAVTDERFGMKYSFNDGISLFVFDTVESNVGKIVTFFSISHSFFGWFLR